jgi:hypothetical protein
MREASLSVTIEVSESEAPLNLDSEDQIRQRASPLEPNSFARMASEAAMMTNCDRRIEVINLPAKFEPLTILSLARLFLHIFSWSMWHYEAGKEGF